MLLERNGWAMFITTPNGPNWFFRLFQKASGDGWERWQRPTGDNPIIKPHELQSAKAESGPRAFAQEYEAQFTEEEGAVFPVEYFSGDIWFDEWPTEGISLKVIACDPSLGRTKHSDYSALVQLAKVYDDYYVAADLQRRPPKQIVNDALDAYREFRADAIGFESIGFQSLLRDEFHDAADAARQEVWSLEIPNGPDASKTRRILRLDAPLSQGRIKFKRGCRGTELLLEQLRGFPLPKYHDDGPDALEMAVRLCEEILSGAVVDRNPEPEFLRP
jgi:phage terminase large subunit-like protein